MSTFTQNWRIVSFTLLMGFLLSAICAPAWAQPQVFFDEGCDTCHGPIVIDPANPIDPARFASNGALTTYIASNMPPGDPAACVGICAQSIADFFVAPTPPVADASNSAPLSGMVPLTVLFDGSASTDDQGIVSYNWNFGDPGSGSNTGAGVTTTHQYMNPGSYTANLTVTDTRGLTHSDTITITVSSAPIPPMANASNSAPLSGVVPLHVVFDGRTSTDDGGIVAYDWDFGDGNTDSGTTGVKTHNYTASGTYTATLTVTDTDGLTDSTTLTIIVSEPGPPTAGLSASRNLKGAAPLTAQLNSFASSCEGVCTYDWDFGDGTTGSGTSLSHIYDTPGEYTVTLTVTTSNGLVDTDTIVVKVVQGESLADYVNACRNQVGFTNLPGINCYDGILFAESGVDGEEENLGATRDFVGYKRINNTVDLAFACRWLAGDRDNPSTPASVEMLVHNRQYGDTCFFAAKAGSAPGGTRVAVSLASPTSPDAEDFWEEPTNVDGSGRRCVECHVAGPIIASPRIADELAILGLLNNGHDTFATRYSAVTPSTGGAFSFWNEIVQDNNVADPCASACHTVGHNSTISDVIFQLPVLLPSISTVIEKVAEEGVMPPNGANSAYRWINRDSVGGSGDRETFSESKNEYSNLLEYCEIPTVLEAHVVGSEFGFTTDNPFPDTMAVFNLRDGLRCVNAEQSDGSCSDYETRYLCDGEWTDWYNMDDPGFTEDNESRPQISGLCAFPTAIEARTILGDAVYQAYGPNDRLAQFNPLGLVCNNADQPNGQCFNYVVRYQNCVDAPDPYDANITNVWSWNLLTATSTQIDAETRAQPENPSWSSQDWVIEPVEGSVNVRIKNIWAGRYLNVQNDNENAKIVTYDLVPEWLSQQWAIEPIFGSSDVRIRNVWTGRYLTVVDTSNYAEILAKTLNPGWASQRWQLN